MAKIKSNKETVENISKAIFSERRNVIDKSFDVLERVLDKNDISDIVKEPPLKDFDSISNAFQNDNVNLIL
ncbi:hypothetical protein ACTPDI_13515 [Clostridioides difficile]